MPFATALLALALHAAPTELVVFDVDASARAPVERATRAKLGKDALDGTSVWLPLFAVKGTLPFAFTTFTEPPPAGWPSSLKRTWSDTLSAFRTIIGPLPMNPADRERMTLLAGINVDAEHLLWERYLTTLAVKNVTVLRLSGEGAERTLSALRYQPGDARTRTFSQPCPQGAEEAVTATVFERLLGGTYMEGTRPLLRSVPTVTPALALEGSDEPAALPVPDDCALPRALDLTLKSPIGAALATRWARTVEGHRTTEPVRCTLTAITSPAALLSAEGLVAFVALQCGELHAVGHVLVEGNGREPPRDQLTFTLLKQVVVDRCPSAAPLYAPKPRSPKDAGR